MPMPERILTPILRGSLIFAGLWPALLYWPFAKVMVLLWLCLCIFLWLSESQKNIVLCNLAVYITLSASFWGIFAIAQPVQWHFALGLFIAFLITERAIRRQETHESDRTWPRKNSILYFVILFCSFWLALHFLMNLFLNKTFEIAWWSSVLVAAISLYACYPVQIDRPILNREKIFFKIFLPILTIIVLIAHAKGRQELENRLWVSSNPNSTAETAFGKGYVHLGVQAVVLHSIQLKETRSWPEAAFYLRSQWPRAGKERFAQFYREFAASQNDLFFFTVTFGCALQLNEQEVVVDWAVLPVLRQIHILTSQGRLLRLDRHGIACLAKINEPVLALSVHPELQRWAILTQSRILFSHHNPIALPVELSWKDIAFDSNGSDLWLLGTKGDVYRVRSQETGKMEILFSTSALWADSQHAQSILPLEMEQACLVLDRFGGVHLQGDAQLNFDQKVLSAYYHPERPVMRDLVHGLEKKEYALLDQSGWVYFVGGGRNEMQVLFPPDEAAGLKTLPQINSLLQITRHGLIIPYVMPQGAPVIFRHRSARVFTDIACDGSGNE